MEKDRIPRQGEIYRHVKDKPCQIVAVATHTKTGEAMVVYQALYGDYKTYVTPLDLFMREVDMKQKPAEQQESKLEQREEKVRPMEQSEEGDDYFGKQADRTAGIGSQQPTGWDEQQKSQEKPMPQEAVAEDTTLGTQEDKVSRILLEFLDAESYYKKLEVLTSNIKHINDRLINDMAVSLDCIVEEGPLEKRIQELLFCLKAMCRFEDKRLR
jgi:hypothetical protein